MAIYVALLRAVNVSGKNIIKMAELKALFEAEGFARVQTYIQSGNVLFESAADPASLRGQIEAAITDRFGLSVTVIMRTPEELARVVERCPFPEADGLYVSFLSAEPTEAGIERLLAVQSEQEEIRVLGREVYLLYRVKASDSKVTNAVIEKRLGVQSTARNWRTTQKLLALAKAMH